MPSARQALGFAQSYWTINREERNYAALLYYALLTGNNLQRFLDFIGCSYPVNEAESAAYVEYAYLRDLWEWAHAPNETRRALIMDLLATDDVRGLQDASIVEWNVHFGVGTPAASTAVIQSPSRWSMQKYHPNIIDNHDFVATCKFKWSFNIKPDLVIHTDNDHAVVIEAKFVSDEGWYPAMPAEKQIFKERGLKPVGQTELQEYMFRHLLGVEATYLFVVQNPHAQSQSHRTLLWSDVFGALDMTQVPTFVREWLRALANKK